LTTGSGAELTYYTGVTKAGHPVAAGGAVAGLPGRSSSSGASTDAVRVVAARQPVRGALASLDHLSTQRQHVTAHSPGTGSSWVSS
jgi:hypothetical protein